jgi:diaminopimelate decarboxylase
VIQDSPAPFRRSGGELRAESVALTELADRFGTPLYVYSAGSFRGRFRQLRDAFARALAPLEPLVAYSVKACSSLGILGLLAREGAAFDVVSGGEVLRVVRAGGDPGRIIFAGVGKTDGELELALEAGVLQVNVESEGELDRLDKIARRRGTRARAALRVNPELDPRTHRHLATGKRASKFGVPVSTAAAILEKRRAFANVRIAGLHVHAGSMLSDAELYVEAIGALAPLVALFGKGELETLDIGGGLAIAAGSEPGLSPETLAGAVAPKILEIGARPILEPGRWIAAPSGLLLTRVLDVKHSGGRLIAVVDAGMNDLIRPALYDAKHPVEAVLDGGGGSAESIDLVGPVCESGDTLARQVDVRGAHPGALLAILDAGAYGFSMASNYNSRPRPAEILVDGAAAHCIRDRETLDDLMRGERLTGG